MNTEVLSAADGAALAKTARVLAEGGIAAIPTETVYGLGASALLPEACREIFRVKGRPQDNPLIIHIAEPEELGRWCARVPEGARKLAAAFWPGPLTMILPKKETIPDVVTAGLDTVAVRCPDSEAMRTLARLLGAPIAAPSANLSGKPSPTAPEHVIHDLMGKIPVILDGGVCRVGLESTIVDLSGERPRLLRPGGVTREALEALLGPVELDAAVTGALPEGERPRSPGMKYRHYAPRARLLLLRGTREAVVDYVNHQPNERAAVLCFAGEEGLFPGKLALSYGSERDPATLAEGLFAALRRLDETDTEIAYARCPDRAGLGLAVVNRLLKAAGHTVIEV